MKRTLCLGLLALSLLLALQGEASAFGRRLLPVGPIPPGVGHNPGWVNRVNGYWMQPSRGPLYDYSAYFAARYPQIPGAHEYQMQPGLPGQFGAAIAIVPNAPPPANPNAPVMEKRIRIEVQPQPPK